MLELIILPPLLAGLFAFAFQRNARRVEAVSLAGAFLSAAFALFAVMGFIQNPAGFRDFYGLLYMDAVSGFFTTLTAVVAFLIFLYSIGYIRHEVKEETVGADQIGMYYGLFSLFLAAMLTSTLAAHPVVMWAAIERSFS